MALNPQSCQKQTPPGAKKRSRKRFPARPLIQAASLILFVWLLGRAAFPLAQSLLPPSFYLSLDPLLTALLPLAAKAWIATLLPLLTPGLLLLALTLIFGRVFCGYLCPFGITLDLVRRILRFFSKPENQTVNCIQQLGNAEFFRLARRDVFSRWGLASSGLPPEGKSKQHSQTEINQRFHNRPYKIKYLLLILLITAALSGVNLLFWAAPIPLITRFYTLLLHPLLLLGASEAQNLALPLWQILEVENLQYLQVTLRRYNSIYFLLIFFGLIFALEKLRPRFWCTCLCPAGALLGLLSLRPLWRRRVSGCIHCGQCTRHCPAGAIPTQSLSEITPLPEASTMHNKGLVKAISPSEVNTLHGECLTCRECVRVCPAGAVRFGFTELASKKSARPATPDVYSVPASNSAPGAACGFTFSPLPGRRAFLASFGGGLLLAGTSYSSLHSPLAPLAQLAGGGRGSLWSADCLRPPGALPEGDFLRLCTRCGACMKACPSNGLQPAWFASGVEGMFSPLLLPRRGPCEPDCNVCGQVCPSAAIRPLPLEEKRWAKLGSAVVLPERCLAFSEGRRCVVCQEVCPYGSIKLVQRDALPGQPYGSIGVTAPVPVPVVDPSRCFGCGYCESHCPVRLPAIVVQPLGALRLAQGSYRQAGLDAGLKLEVAGAGYPQSAYEYPSAMTYPGESAGEPGRAVDPFSPDAGTLPGSANQMEGGLPPGFTD